ncbi:Retinol dehydrogenase 5 [Rhizophlyctis rosea]|uniref:Retinol dehydrogenase 5 n=1 Tax=Rhizophlyctis rosea TaxID=64517 RepID=A0AAD5SAF6_9FUNG|nr:Retinol dehydrogenase 5 [Rhizophlyctis rosea]
MGLAYSILPPQGPVIISGCDTGFGNLLALRLARAGWTVYATCLTTTGSDSLTKEGLPNLTVFSVDITKDDSVRKFGEDVEKLSPNGIYALINNAGISGGHVIEWTSMDEYRRIMDVNFFGHVSMTKAFLPSLRKYAKSHSGPQDARPRVVFVSSIAGLVTSYCISAYSASKHAIESFASSLRLEMDPFDVIVSVVGPTFARTPLAMNAFVGLEKRIEGLDEELKEVYGVDAMKRLQKAYETNTLTGIASVEVDEVVKTLEETVVRKVPWERYAVGLVAKYWFPLFRVLPWSFGKYISGGHAYSAVVKKYAAKAKALKTQ